MAPSQGRRPGYSRRAQFMLFLGYLAAAFGLILGGALLMLSLRDRDPLQAPRTAAIDAIAPVGEAAARPRLAGYGLIENIRAHLDAAHQNRMLREEIARTRVALHEARATRAENARLKQLMELRETDSPPVAYARLIGSSATSARRFAYIGKGRRDGIAPGMPVRAPLGVVGRVLEAGERSARVLLLTDTQSIVPVRRAQDEVVAFAEGRGDGLLRIRLINLGINPLKPGDVFVTSGTGGIFRPGVAVAVVTEITPDGAMARMVADPSASDFVAIEPIWEPAAAPAAASAPERELDGASGDGGIARAQARQR